MSPDIAQNLEGIRMRIAEAALRSGRKADQINLLAVTKTFPVKNIQQAYDLGLRDFGENRVQEAITKIAELPKDIRWHLIGQLQTNKINKVLGKFILIHSVDTFELAQALSTRLGSFSQEILLEVNTSRENTKSGVNPPEALSVAQKISALQGVKLRGLMTVGPLTEDKGRQREAFKELKGLFEQIRREKWAGPSFGVLSMGMSGDFEVAIEEGSTLIRVGTALFGSRG